MLELTILIKFIGYMLVMVGSVFFQIVIRISICITLFFIFYVAWEASNLDSAIKRSTYCFSKSKINFLL